MCSVKKVIDRINRVAVLCERLKRTGYCTSQVLLVLNSNKTFIREFLRKVISYTCFVKILKFDQEMNYLCL